MDYVVIYDGNSSSSSTVVTVLFGDKSSLPAPIYYSTQNYMLITFTTDGSYNERGFLGYFKIISTHKYV